MLTLTDGEQQLDIELLEYEYPPGWGAGMPYNTDYLMTRITWTGSLDFEVEDSFLRYSEIEAIYEASIQVLSGESFGFNAVIEDPRCAMTVQIDQADLLVTWRFVDDMALEVSERMNPVAFQKMVDRMGEALREMARM